jgi:arylsulfatase A-like enzyme
MNRRDFLQMSLGTAIAMTSVSYADIPESSIKNPNLLIIHTDEHNFRTLGCYRRTLTPEQAFIWGKDAVVETPNIDWLAERGALCTKFYANTPVCSPSRSSFVSGQYPQHTPVIINDIAMSDDIVTFAQVLKGKGYSTGYAGKWHLDGFGRPQWQPKRKFGFEDNRYMFNRGHWKQLEDTPEGPRVVTRNENGEPTYQIEGATKENFTTDFLTNKAIDFIKTHKNKPFCYMLSIPDPHGPNTVRPPYDTMYENIEFQMPRSAVIPSGRKPIWAPAQLFEMNNDMMRKYFGMVKCIDDNVGRILDTLRREKLIDNTIVIFTSDHGDLCFEHNRHDKGNPYEASAKIPFILYYPQKVRAGTRIDKTLSCVDFKPTILSLMEFSCSGKRDGRDASKLFTNSRGSSDWDDITFLRGIGQLDGTDDNNWIAAVTSRYKLIYHPKDKPWLFDLKKDPDEIINFYKDPAYNQTVKELAGKLVEYGKKYDDPRIWVPSIKSEIDRVLDS